MLSAGTVSLLLIVFILLFLFISKSNTSKKLHQDLKKSTHYQKSLDYIKLPIYFKDDKQNIIDCNETFNTSFGQFKKKALEDLSLLQSTCQKELQLTYDNGVTKSIIVHFFNFFDENKKISGGIGVLFDISTLSLQRDKFLRQRDVLAFSISGAREGYWEWNIKTNDILFSKRAKEILGYEENEQGPQTLSSWLNIVESYDIAKTNEALSLHMKGEIPFIDVSHRLKTSLNEKWVNVRGQAIFSADAKSTIVYGTIRDISNTKREEMNLKRERDLFTTFMDNLPALAFIKNKNGKYMYLNDFFQKLLGFKEWKDKTATEIFDKVTAKNIEKSDREALYEGIVVSEQIIPGEEGSKKLFSTHKFPIADFDGKALCGFGLDITQERDYLNRINLYLKVFESTNEAIVITDAAGFILDANKAYEQLTGLRKKQLLGQKSKIRSSGENTPEFYKDMWAKLIKEDMWKGEIINKSQEGISCREMLSISSIKDTNNVVTNYIGIYQNIEQQKLIEELLRKQAHFDELTKLPNRLFFNHKLEDALSRADKNNTIMGLVFVDLDDFKIINDTKGHDAGDIVLKEVAQRLCEVSRSNDTAARLGGDEFVVILEKISSIEDIAQIAQKIIDALLVPIALDEGSSCKVGASLGISIYPNHSKEKSELLKFADSAMYKAKTAGKNCYKIYKND